MGWEPRGRGKDRVWGLAGDWGWWHSPRYVSRGRGRFGEERSSVWDWMNVWGQEDVHGDKGNPVRLSGPQRLMGRLVPIPQRCSWAWGESRSLLSESKGRK